MRIAAGVLADDGGQDLIEYALLTAIITVAGLLVLSTLPKKMGEVYTSWNMAGQNAWVPPCPQSKTCP